MIRDVLDVHAIARSLKPGIADHLGREDSLLTLVLPRRCRARAILRIRPALLRTCGRESLQNCTECEMSGPHLHLIVVHQSGLRCHSGPTIQKLAQCLARGPCPCLKRGFARKVKPRRCIEAWRPTTERSRVLRSDQDAAPPSTLD